MRQTKDIPSFAVKSDDSTRTITGVCAVFGNVDSYGDRLHPGAFTKTISEGKQNFKHLWNHDFSNPPIASILDIKEISRNELPTKVLDYAPDATGGLLVMRQYYDDQPKSQEVWAALKRGDINQMSFGFNPKKVDFSTEGEGAQEIRVRELREVQLFDTSDVLWGANSATVADSTKKLYQEIPLEQIAYQLSEMLRELKSGARNAASDMKMLNSIHEMTVKLGASNCMGVKSEDESNAKSNSQAEAALSTSLQEAKLLIHKLNLLNLEN